MSTSRYFLAVIGSLLLARVANAAPSLATLEWKANSYADSAVKACLTSHYNTQTDVCTLGGTSQEFFSLNQLPLTTVQTSYTRHGHGGKTGLFTTGFSTSLLKIGQNVVRFHAVSLYPEGAHFEHWVNLESPRLSLMLFHGRARGRNYNEQTEFSASLEQIDFDLANDLERLRQAVRDRINVLNSRGPDADRARAEAARLEALLEALDELLERGFDQIHEEDLEALLQGYDDIAPHLLEQLRNVVRDFRILIDDLRAEIIRLTEDLQSWQDSVLRVDSSTTPFTEGEFEVGDDGTLPPIDVPDVLGEDEYDDTNNPYDRYATEVLEQLVSTVQDGQIVNRPAFLAIVSAWRMNIFSLRVGLEARNVVSQREWGAFLQSQTRVLSFLALYMTEDGWFKDNNLDPEARELVDVALKRVDAPRAERLKAALNLHAQMGNSEAGLALAVVFVLHEYSIAVQQATMEARRAELAGRTLSLWDTATTFFENAALLGWDVALSITPLGDFIDVCEAVTGKPSCRVWATENLSWEQRAFAAVGLLMWGSSSAFRRLGRAVDRACNLGALTLAAPPRQLPCNAIQFFQAMNAAVDRITPRFPRANILGSQTFADGRRWYKRRGIDGFNDGRDIEVNFTKQGFAEYTREHMYSGIADPEQWVEFTCGGSTEGNAANRQANLGDRPPTDYKWHHSHEFQRRNGKVHIKMQLVRAEIHDWAAHNGGMAIGKQILGAENCR